MMSKKKGLVDRIPWLVISFANCEAVFTLPVNDTRRLALPTSHKLSGLKISSGLLIGGEIPKTANPKPSKVVDDVSY